MVLTNNRTYAPLTDLQEPLEYDSPPDETSYPMNSEIRCVVVIVLNSSVCTSV